MSDDKYTEDLTVETELDAAAAPAEETAADAPAEVEAPEQEASQDEAAEDGAPEEAAPASPEEEAIAKLRRKLYMSPGDWYVIHTYSGHERKVKANLEQRITTQNMEDYIFAVEVPDEYVMEYRGNAKKRVRKIEVRRPQQSGPTGRKSVAPPRRLPRS